MTLIQPQDNDPSTIELRVRSLAPEYGQAKQQAVIDRLDRLEADGTIDGYTVQVWGKRCFPIDEPRIQAECSVNEWLVELDEWAARTGLSAAQYFRVRSGHSWLTDTRSATVVTPTMLLAEYDGADLRHASPCTDGDTHYGVLDHLDALADGTERATGRPETRPTRVPAIMPAVRAADTSHGRTSDGKLSDEWPSDDGPSDSRPDTGSGSDGGREIGHDPKPEGRHPNAPPSPDRPLANEPIPPSQ